MSLLLLLGGWGEPVPFTPSTYGGDDDPDATYGGDDVGAASYGGDAVLTSTYGGDTP